jgi:cyclopropane-fatty-acyl-phospholipid synthase
VRDGRLFWRVARDGEVGFGESYVDGDWDCEDLASLVSIFHLNQGVLYGDFGPLVWIGALRDRVIHLLRANTRWGSRKNIQAHYDLGDELFGRMLDESMTYSCALYESPDQSLEDAQRNKLRALVRRARIAPEHHVLEIGSGWGSLALEAARSTGCRVTGITLSENQLETARRCAREAGLEDRVSFELRDYRDIEGRFDRILSCEMLEAVGHENLGRFFEACDGSLAPDGLVALQVITFPDHLYERYRRRCDWLQKYIFPGGVAPSLTAMSAAMARRTRLMVDSLENIGPHYAPTLREWRRRFEDRWEELEPFGYDERFRRTWRYYLAYCEAGFATRTFRDLHLVLSRGRGPGGARPHVVGS